MYYNIAIASLRSFKGESVNSLVYHLQIHGGPSKYVASSVWLHDAQGWWAPILSPSAT